MPLAEGLTTQQWANIVSDGLIMMEDGGLYQCKCLDRHRSLVVVLSGDHK